MHYIISMDSLTRYFKATAAELKQVSWPTQSQALLYTALVIGISLAVALFVAAFDFVFAEGIKFVTGL
jgi:preprotein translocase subunit SecE